jgi:hypothetical protein
MSIEPNLFSQKGFKAKAVYGQAYEWNFAFDAP